jgi:hypothetical protein
VEGKGSFVVVVVVVVVVEVVVVEVEVEVVVVEVVVVEVVVVVAVWPLSLPGLHTVDRTHATWASRHSTILVVAWLLVSIVCVCSKALAKQTNAEVAALREKVSGMHTVLCFLTCILAAMRHLSSVL